MVTHHHMGNITTPVNKDSDLSVYFRGKGGDLAGYFRAEDEKRGNPPVV
jgi:hypothetical protein